MNAGSVGHEYRRGAPGSAVRGSGQLRVIFRGLHQVDALGGSSTAYALWVGSSTAYAGSLPAPFGAGSPGWWDEIQLGGANEAEVRWTRDKDFKPKSSETVFELKTAECDARAARLATRRPAVHCRRLRFFAPIVDLLAPVIVVETLSNEIGSDVGRHSIAASRDRC